MNIKSYVTKDDCSLVILAKSGDNEAFDALAKRYKNLILSCVKSKKSSNMYEDLLQESHFGFFKAILNYDSSLNVPFCSYAKLCVERQVISAIKKNEKFNIEDFSFCEVTDSSISLEEAVIERQSVKDLVNLVSTRLSGYERQVLKLYLLDLSYEEISVKLGKNVKSIDNALKRIKSKKFLAERS